MKLTFILLTAAFLQVSATGTAQTVTYKAKNEKLEKVFSEIKRQTGFLFFYTTQDLETAKRVTVVLHNVSIEEALDKVLADQPLEYVIKGNTIFIKARQSSTAAFQPAESTQPPPVDIRGRIVNENGEPVIATVMVKGMKIGSTTNANGEFELKGIDENAVLVVSGVSIETMEIAVAKNPGLKAGDGLTITAKTEITTLNEVVINKGYYTEKQKFSVGNVTTVKAADIEKQPVQNPLLALQGRVPGLVVTQLTGTNGGAVQVRIQGQNSLSSGSLNPLIIVDGIPYPSDLFLSGSGFESPLRGGSPLNYINTNDIESIDVLKDADATAIYGSRAANGAILITTKKGKAGKTKLTVNLQQGWGKVTRHVDMMNTRQYLDMRYEAYKNDGINTTTLTPNNTNYDLTLWDTTRYTDWQKTLIGGTAKYTNVNASISGGTAAMQYLIGGTYNRQTTVYPGNFDNQSGGMHFNVSGASPNQRFHIALSGSYVYNDNHLPNADLTSIALTMEPNAPALFNQNGTLNWAPNSAGNSTWTNPLAYTISSDFNHTTKNLISNAIVRYNIFRGLEFVGNFGFTSLQNDLYSPRRLEVNPPEQRANSVRSSAFNHRNMNTWIIEPQLQYSLMVGKGKIEALAGSTFQKNYSDLMAVSASGFSNDQLMQSPVAAPTKTVLASSSMLYKYSALFGRLNYNLDGKYIINLTARRDGSSRFGDANKFHNFGSVGLGWIFSQEKLIQRGLSFLSFGKLRASYGTTGNDQIGDYKYISTYTTFSDPIPYQNLAYLRIINLPNPHLQWEETKKWQAGLDLGLIRDQIVLGATYVRNQSSNQLTGYTLPFITGFSGITQNFPATIRNTSWEFTLNTVNVKRRDLSWSTSFNLTLPKNKLISFPNIANTPYASGNGGIIVGQPLGIIKMYPYGGIDPATGQYALLDNNGKPTISPTGSTVSQSVLVSTLPKFYGGFENTIRYKGFQLSFLIQFIRQKNSRDYFYYNGKIAPGNFNTGNSNQPVAVVNRWMKPGDNATIGKFTTSNSFSIFSTLSDVWYSYDASYARLKNVAFSWQLPKIWLQSVKLQNCLVYFNGQNLMTITKYKGLDPETGSVSLPPLQMWTIGAKIEL